MTMDSAISEVHFTPNPDCQDRIVQLLESVDATADICMFTLTDDRIAETLRRMVRKPNVKIRIVTDSATLSDTGSDILDLRDRGIGVRADKTGAFMHHKFAVLDGWILITGSYNWTGNAARKNYENVIITSEPTLVRRFVEEFDRLWRALPPV